MKKHETRNKPLIKLTSHRFFSFTIVCMLFIASFTVVIMVLPDQATAEIAEGGSWVSPSGYEDPNSDWNDESEAYDGSTASSAQTTVGYTDWTWTSFIELTHGSMRCTKIKFYAWYDNSYCRTMDLDRSNGGSSWTGVFQSSFLDRQWVTKTFSETTVTHARIRFEARKLIGYVYPDVFELEFFWLAPTGSAQDAQNVEGTSATFRGYISDTNGKDCEYQFRYGLTSGSYGINPTWENEVGTGYFSKASPTLSKGRMYYYRAYIRNGYSSAEKSDRVVTFAEKTFLTKPDPLTEFTATPFGIGQINLTWANGAGGDGAYIEYRTTDPGGEEGVWNPGDQTKIDTDGYVAGTSFAHTGLERNKSYWYKAWPYAEDDSEKSDGSSTKPYGTETSVIDESTEDFPGQWFVVGSSNLHSCCEGESPDLEAALDGTNVWSHNVDETHWFIIDLGTNYTIGSVRGRSFSASDPTKVNIYVSRNSTFSEGTAEEDRAASDISTWQDTADWVTVDSTDKDGRYIKVEITDTEHESNYIMWGKPLDMGFNIFDVFVSNCLPEMKWSSNTSTPDSGSPISFDASESFDKGGSITSYKWDFDNDGYTDQTTADPTTTFSYNISGVYYPTVTGVDNASSENESQALAVTVKQKISVVNNSKNDGINYMTWGATASILASELASDLGLDTGDTLRKFDPGTGDWSTWLYMVGIDEPGGERDFTVNRWDHLQIHTNSDHMHSFTPDGEVSTSHNTTMIFDDINEGYNYITWSNDFAISPENFAASLGGSGVAGENVEFYVYKPATDTWLNYNPKYPDFATLTSIAPYDVICFRAPEHANIYYDTDDW